MLSVSITLSMTCAFPFCRLFNSIISCLIEGKWIYQYFGGCFFCFVFNLFNQIYYVFTIYRFTMIFLGYIPYWKKTCLQWMKIHFSFFYTIVFTPNPSYHCEYLWPNVCSNMKLISGYLHFLTNQHLCSKCLSFADI